MKKYLLTSLSLLSAIAMTSCLSSSTEDYTTTYNYGGSDCFNRIVDLNDGSDFIASAPSYTLQYKGSQVDITLSNLILSQGASALSFKLPTMKYSQDPADGFIVTNEYAVSPAVGTSAYLFNPFNLRFLPRNSRLGSIFYIRYTLEINSQPRYEVTTYANNYVYLGPITATNMNDQSVYNTKDNVQAQAETNYAVMINQEKRTAKFVITNGKFADNMSPLNFLVQDLPLTFTNSGYYISAGIDTPLAVYTATSGDKPAEGMSMSNLSIVGNLKEGANISFTCDLGDSGKYSVNAPLRYLIYNTGNDNKN